MNTDGWPWEFLPVLAAQITALAVLAAGAGWLVRRLVRWWRKLRVWKDAIAQEHFAERAAQHLDAAIAPRFIEMNRRIGRVEAKFQEHLDESQEQRKRDDAAAEERSLLFEALREHMAREDARAEKENP